VYPGLMEFKEKGEQQLPCKDGEHVSTGIKYGADAVSTLFVWCRGLNSGPCVPRQALYHISPISHSFCFSYFDE
jgi:hypothetical protein